MARRTVDPKARSARAISQKRFARNRSVRTQQFANQIMVADVRRKPTAVMAELYPGGATKRTPIRRPGKQFTSAKTESLRAASPGQRHRTALASAKDTRRRVRQDHPLPEPYRSRHKAAEASDRAKLGGRARSRRAGFLKSKGGATGRRFTRRVFKRDARGRFA